MRAGAGQTQLFVAGGKLGQVGLLVVEHLHDLLPGDYFLNVSVQLAQAALLLGIVGTAVLGGKVDVPEHAHITHRHQQREPPVEDKQHQQGAHDLDKGLDNDSKAVVQCIGDGVHIVGEKAHQIAVAVGIKVLQRLGLQVGKQILADLLQYFLRGAHHQLGIAQGGQRTNDINAGGKAHGPGQVGFAAVFQQAVDYRADHVGAKQCGQGADGRQQRHQANHDAVAAQIGAELPQRAAQILRALAAGDFLFTRHRGRLPSSGNSKFPDRSCLFSEARRGCPRRAGGHPPRLR